MCGICGKVSFCTEFIEKSLIEKMCKTIVHRGPDDRGVYCSRYIGLGQQRLSIIDLDKMATAPLSNEDKTIWTVFNGEIYNFKEIRQELQSKGHLFLTKTDTEVLVHLYEEYGVKCLDKLRGMFAFVIWDGYKKQLFAARDRLGQKPFCYSKTDKSFIFGSSIKAILQDPEVSASPNYTAIDRYLTYHYIHSPLTAFENIYKLPAGHYLIYDKDHNIKIERYWHPHCITKTNLDTYQIEQELIRNLENSVKMQMVSDVPIGAFLSGGIDSAVIVALMAKQSIKPIKTFTIGFEEDDFNEIPYARLISKRYETDHNEFIVRPDAVNLLPDLIRHYNEPFADPSAIPTYYISQMTRKHVTVAISGDGGDESFAGYDRYARMLKWNFCDFIPKWFRSLTAGSIRKIIESCSYTNTSARIARGFQLLESDISQRYLLEMTTFKSSEKDFLYSSDFKGIVSQNILFDDSILKYYMDGKTDSLDWMMMHDQNFYLPDCLMVKTDVASMANSLEVRSPFLDHKFIEFTSTIPSKFKHDGSHGKIILKNAIKNLVPEEILTKHKTGFGIPIAKWLRTNLQDMMESYLLDDKAVKRGLFKYEGINKLVQEHISLKRDWSNRLWTLLVLEIWFREFID